MRSVTAFTEFDAVRHRVRTNTTLSDSATQWLLRARYNEIPNRLAFALEKWPLATSRVLDVGCSFGHCLAQFGPGSIGLDNVEEHVAFCRDIGLEAVKADVDEGLPGIPDQAFDYIWISDIVEHLDAPRLTLRRLAPKLGPDGRLLLYITTRPSSRLVREALYRRGITAFRAGTHYYQFTRDTAQFLLARAGYRVESVSVPMARGRLRPVGSMLASQAPTLIFEAVPDARNAALVDEAERKNKPSPTTH